MGNEDSECVKLGRAAIDGDGLLGALDILVEEWALDSVEEVFEEDVYME